MRRLLNRFLLCIALLALHPVPLTAAEEWKAGVAKVRITPTNAIWLTGFAARTNVSQGKLHELYVKVLALEDANGKKAILITSDLLGFPASVSENIAAQVKKQFGIPRD